MPTFSVTISDKERHAKAVERFKKFKDKMKGKTYDVDTLEFIFDIAEGQDVSKRTQETPVSAQEAIDEIHCQYLQYDGNWYCLELVHRTKKKKDLGWNAKETIALCNSCKEGKADQIREQYQKKLRGQNIKGILQMINLFQKFAEEGVPTTIYFCNRIPGRQIMTGQKTITCPKHDSKVPIDPTCKDPKCPHFEEYNISVQQEFPEQTLHLIEGIVDDYKLIEDLTPKKTVEAEKVDQDV